MSKPLSYKDVFKNRKLHKFAPILPTCCGINLLESGKYYDASESTLRNVGKLIMWTTKDWDDKQNKKSTKNMYLFYILYAPDISRSFFAK